jgi:hypothetical protein
LLVSFIISTSMFANKSIIQLHFSTRSELVLSVIIITINK